MSLGEYRRKRNAKLTPEPFAGKPSPGKAPIFVVQRHDARNLHYDFRLERNGAPAGLAVHVEDHPIAYATFAGEIPKGQYGAGSVEIWDSGVYELLEEKKNGQLKVRLAGKRLKGTWSLVPAHLDGNPKNWLLIRNRDEAASEPSTPTTYSPMLASLNEGLPTGGEWLYEVKFDGYRALAYVRGGECRLDSRNDKDLTERFSAVAEAVVKATKSPSSR